MEARHGDRAGAERHLGQQHVAGPNERRQVGGAAAVAGVDERRPVGRGGERDAGPEAVGRVGHPPALDVERADPDVALGSILDVE